MEEFEINDAVNKLPEKYRNSIDLIFQEFLQPTGCLYLLAPPHQRKDNP